MHLIQKIRLLRNSRILSRMSLRLLSITWPIHGKSLTQASSKLKFSVLGKIIRSYHLQTFSSPLIRSPWEWKLFLWFSTSLTIQWSQRRPTWQLLLNLKPFIQLAKHAMLESHSQMISTLLIWIPRESQAQDHLLMRMERWLILSSNKTLIMSKIWSILSSRAANSTQKERLKINS